MVGRSALVDRSASAQPIVGRSAVVGQSAYAQPMLLMSWLTLIIVYRVHWLRALLLCDRAIKEATIIEHEMNWTVSEFKHRQMIWSS